MSISSSEAGGVFSPFTEPGGDGSPWTDPGGEPSPPTLEGERDFRDRVTRGETDLEPLLDLDCDFLSRICEATDFLLLPGLLPGGGVGWRVSKETSTGGDSDLFAGLADRGLDVGVGARARGTAKEDALTNALLA